MKHMIPRKLAEAGAVTGEISFANSAKTIELIRARERGLLRGWHETTPSAISQARSTSMSNCFFIGQQLASHGADLPEQHVALRSSIVSRNTCYDLRRCNRALDGAFRAPRIAHEGGVRTCKFTPCRCIMRNLTTGWLRKCQEGLDQASEAHPQP